MDATTTNNPADTLTDTLITTSSESSSLTGLLAIPYVILCLILCVLAVSSFMKYRKRHREKYVSRSTIAIDPIKQKYRVTLSRNAVINGQFFGRREFITPNGDISDFVIEDYAHDDRWKAYLNDYRCRYRDYHIKRVTSKSTPNAKPQVHKDTNANVPRRPQDPCSRSTCSTSNTPGKQRHPIRDSSSADDSNGFKPRRDKGYDMRYQERRSLERTEKPTPSDSASLNSSRGETYRDSRHYNFTPPNRI